MTVDDVFDSFERGFARRKFSAGLLIAFIDFLRDLGTPKLGLRSLEAFYAALPRVILTRRGTTANQLIVQQRDGTTIGIRPFYNQVEYEIRTIHHRLDYPSCAPHATQAWHQHADWLEVLVTLDDATLVDLRKRVLDFVLNVFPNQDFDPSDARQEPPLFRNLLASFDITAREGEPTGAAYQGLVFGFLRADNPHLQVEIRKVRTGSARKKGIGDIDCWDGGSLAISAEVKQMVLDNADFGPFANDITRRGALGLVVALDFASDEVRDQIEDLGVRAIDRDDLLRIVELWDPIKQRVAVSSLFYYLDQVEQKSALSRRFSAFIREPTDPNPSST